MDLIHWPECDCNPCTCLDSEGILMEGTVTFTTFIEGLSDMELIVTQSQLRQHPDDKHHLDIALKELKYRPKCRKMLTTGTGSTHCRLREGHQGGCSETRP